MTSSDALAARLRAATDLLEFMASITEPIASSPAWTSAVLDAIARARNASERYLDTALGTPDGTEPAEISAASRRLALAIVGAVDAAETAAGQALADQVEDYLRVWSQ